MRILKEKEKYIFIALIVAFSAFVFSCCNTSIEHAEQSNKCCHITKLSAAASLHNQPLFMGLYGNMLRIISILALSVFVSAIFAKMPVARRYLLYEQHVHRNKGSTKLYNLFTHLFSKGILHPQVF